MVSIKILGSGCANCKRLESVVANVIAERGINAAIEKVTDYAQMMRWNILQTPGLVINDTLVSAGRIPSESEIAGWLTQG